MFAVDFDARLHAFGRIFADKFLLAEKTKESPCRRQIKLCRGRRFFTAQIFKPRENVIIRHREDAFALRLEVSEHLLNRVVVCAFGLWRLNARVHFEIN